MTGFGEARYTDERMSVQVELRAVNNRHLKLNAKIAEPYANLEADFERLVRDVLRRGTVQMSVRVERPRRAEDYRLNAVALASYRDQVAALAKGHGPFDFGALLGLPGVVESRREAQDDPRDDWPILAKVVGEALSALQATRAEEGRAMAVELRELASEIAAGVGRVELRGPEVVSGYQTRLRDRVQALVEGYGITISTNDLIREVSILAERADVAEEIVRLRAHLSQFAGVLEEPESNGRKLEFIVQEMGREMNTIGSKSNDIEISRHIFDMKGALERVRELIANVE